MNHMEYEAIAGFSSVGALKELIKNYPDDTPVYVCGARGLFYPNAQEGYILLETEDGSGYGAICACSEMDMDDGYMDY
jgi:hypothetical protein